MRLKRRTILISAIAVAVVLIAGGVTAAALQVAGSGIPSDSLRALGKRAGLRIGTAVNTDELGSNSSYDTILGQQFSTVTAENAMKWGLVEKVRGKTDYSAADRLVDFARAHGQLVRGHNLVWFSQLPGWLTKAAPSMSKAELRTVLDKHIKDEVGHFRGRIWQWDVVNEPLADDGTIQHSFWYKAIGPDYIADAFRWAHEADPQAKLFLNDFDMEFGGAKTDGMLKLAKTLRADGVPVDGVGFEGHLDTRFGEPGLLTNLQAVADAGFDVAVTEMDVRTYLPADGSVQAEQGDIYASALQACIQVPRCLSFTVWGFEDTLSWVPDGSPGEGAADLYDHYRAKPQYGMLQRVLKSAPKASAYRH